MKELIYEYQKARQELIVWIGLVPVKKRKAICVGEWSVKDILAHLTGWAQFQNQVINDLLKGRKGNNIADVKEYNRQSVRKRTGWHWDKVYKEFLKETEKLLSNYMRIPDNWWKNVTLVKLIKIETSHYQGEHLEQIKKLARKQAAGIAASREITDSETRKSV